MAGRPFESNRPLRRAWLWLALWALIALLAYVVIIGHRNHVLDFLPYVLLLVCPLMHVFMHGRHGHHHRHNHARRTEQEPIDEPNARPQRQQ